MEINLTKEELSAVLDVLECDSLLELNSEDYLGEDGWDEDFYELINSAVSKLGEAYSQM